MQSQPVGFGAETIGLAAARSSNPTTKLEQRLRRDPGVYE